jgi:Zn-dependent protease
VLWTIGIVAVVAILIRAHKITGVEIVLFCVIVPSIILHEIAHGWVALAFGDDTAKRAGRLTLNPIAHIDPIGTLIVPALMALSGIGMFGWAKPVPVNVSRLRHPRNEAVLVSLAGPVTNVLLAAVAYLVFRAFHGDETITLQGTFGALWAEVVFYFGLVNIWLAVFNMVPVPPLDGSVLFERLLPRAWWPGYLRIRRYTMPILIGLLLLNFYLNPGPLTWLFDHLFNWWAGRLGLG